MPLQWTVGPLVGVENLLFLDEWRPMILRWKFGSSEASHTAPVQGFPEQPRILSGAVQHELRLHSLPLCFRYVSLVIDSTHLFTTRAELQLLTFLHMSLCSRLVAMGTV
jgi:hypothetical protein